MARLNIAPTKSNQLNLKRDLAMATEGFSLLEQKREILVIELMHLLNSVKSVQLKLAERQKQAYASLRRALARDGFLALEQVAERVHYDHTLQHETKVTAGIHTPVIHVKQGKYRQQYGFAGTDSSVDLVMQDFLKLLEIAGKLAEMETTVWLLARELKKTQRRVNALEHIFIPNYKDTMHYIEESLEGKELDSFFTMKMLKKKLNGQSLDSSDSETPKTDTTEP